MRVTVEKGPVPGRRVSLPRGVCLSLRWLGQAGFLLDTADARVLIDPYLSDTLAAKYAGTRFPHRRMAPPPIDPGDIRDVDLVLCTHGHGDHLDPGSLVPLALANPRCRFAVPASGLGKAAASGLPADRLVGADAFHPFEAVRGIFVSPIPSAHENLAVDGAGHHLCLGFVVGLGGLRVYHAGDCVPYPGLVGNLGFPVPDLALLPVNGRDGVRTSAGILGNFTLAEAVDLAEEAGFSFTIGHHLEMFDFNTLDRGEGLGYLSERGADRFVLASPGTAYLFEGRARSPADGKDPENR